MDYDYIVIGSGFGGSVSALRLAEKGYRVAVMEMGRRWNPEDFPKTNWSIRRFIWRPALGLRGFFNISVFRHVLIFHQPTPCGARTVLGKCDQWCALRKRVAFPEYWPF
jgi:choline dehydrogenase-like flavoprotein